VPYLLKFNTFNRKKLGRGLKPFSHKEIPSNQLLLNEIINNGSYGIIYKAKYKDIDVAAKIIPNKCNNESFKRELTMLIEIGEHKNSSNYLDGSCFSIRITGTRSLESFVTITLK